MNHTLLLSSIFCFFFFTQTTNAQVSSAPSSATIMMTKLRVYGNCDMCKKRIEKAAKIEGVTSADWDQETQIMTVHFELNKTRPIKIHEAVAAAGHDTDKRLTADEDYENLHKCCKYERPARH